MEISPGLKYTYFFLIYYFQLIEKEVFKFEEQICDFEEDLAATGSAAIPDEEVKDAVFAAVGKAKLLMAQKLAQFRGLCDKNIVSSILVVVIVVDVVVIIVVVKGRDFFQAARYPSHT